MYRAIVKRRIRQAFDQVNQRRWDELMASISPERPPSLRRRPRDRWRAA